MPLDFNEIRQLLATIAQTDIAEVTLKSDEFELTVRKAVSFNNQIPPLGQATVGGVLGSVLTSVPTGNNAGSASLDVATGRDNSGGGSQAPLSVNVSSTKFVEVSSPMVGTFYRAPAPDEAAFVEVGDRVRSGQTVCIIEAMKLMNEIEAEVSGQVMEILVQNGDPVEYGQPLMRINPD
ncbi:acetyl-CoA carboxylase biotin carboxyl carrier protein [Cronbergia sp. UHCC 0137]|uniref:acetyl-CoA carboxylase biotin carboxyl carrier protein n=1 Tax=Cronbergia sp. UHCC 0137 TaxID=3110239 RepID=UPI002B207CAA|nr:acetyl-CoA carboxylase biotin carboxyl carrier protein [Cronbergia sp. UHCC 0137]MEA5618928.1 acetyl-CoA carboxylase biotin carboxyl carrier protein [Cronbergia sp. UHCC 0137]